MRELDLLKFMHPALRLNAELEKLFISIGETLTWYRLLYLNMPVERWFVYLMGLFDRLKDDAAHEVLERLAVPSRVRKRIMVSRQHCRDILFEFYRSDSIPSSRVYDLLRPLDIEQLLIMMAKARKEPAKKYISLYLTRLREIRIMITGDTLKELGLPPGPRYKKILTGLLDAKLDGKIDAIEDEIAFVKKALKKQ